MKTKFVIYRDKYGWEGAGEFKTGRWPFRKIQHAPVTHAGTAEEVFAWLFKKYPGHVIAYEPSLTERYTEKERT